MWKTVKRWALIIYHWVFFIGKLTLAVALAISCVVALDKYVDYRVEKKVAFIRSVDRIKNLANDYPVGD